MLGGSVYIALIRFAFSLLAVILFYSKISESRFGRKKTVVCYTFFCVALLSMACAWYVADWESCVRMVAFVMYMFFILFAIWVSKGSIYVKLYKLALVFYLLAVFLIGGLEVSVLFFDRNVWADIITRILLVTLITLLLEKYVKKSILGFGHYVEKEADWFSVAVMIICILFGIGFILNPSLNKEVTPHRIYQVGVNFFLTGALQFLIFRFYLHVGREKEYERENQLIQMNYRLLERQMELLDESVETVRRIRHDVRHHTAVIAEFVHRGQKEELIKYLKEYERETDSGIPEKICANAAVNNILSAYTRKAKREAIQVTLDIEIGKNLAIQSIDLVAILANAYENAIYACMEVKKKEKERECFIQLMMKIRNNKLIIVCSNTCRVGTRLEDGKPRTEFTGGVGVSSIIRTAEKYGGEYDFKNDEGVFVFRLIMNTSPVSEKDRHLEMED